MGAQAMASLKGISFDHAKKMMDQVAVSAKIYGLNYQMDKILMVSTLKAHRLFKWAKRFNKELELTELLMDAYFAKGFNIADNDILLKFVSEISLDRKEALEVLLSDMYLNEVNEDINEAASLNVRGVPFFVFNRKYAIFGAQSDQIFEQTLKKAFQEAHPFSELNEDNDSVCVTDECSF